MGHPADGYLDKGGEARERKRRGPRNIHHTYKYSNYTDASNHRQKYILSRTVVILNILYNHILIVPAPPVPASTLILFSRFRGSGLILNRFFCFGIIVITIIVVVLIIVILRTITMFC